MTDNKNTQIFAIIANYKNKSRQLQDYLSQHPDDWPKFQSEFDQAIEDILHNMLIFEKENIVKCEWKVYKLRKIFEKRFRRYFLYGDYVRHSYQKPFGYPGDFKIIDDIYLNKPRTAGFERLWDICFQKLAAAQATRERKEDFKKIIYEFAAGRKGRDLRIMNLASGPAREIKELLEVYPSIFSKAIFDCYELDDNAISYASQLLNNAPNVNFYKKNAIKLALRKDVTREIEQKYDLVYSTGLFDYLDERIASKLIANLKSVLKDDGMMCISNYADKYSNSSAYLMEWVAEWNLIYRTEKEFKQLFINAGFAPSQLTIVRQKSRVMHYCIARMK
jgi:hypothetical protein